jgi:hypothetical protein
MKDDSREFPIPEPFIETFEPLQFVYYFVRHSAATASGDDLKGLG